jgi:hypothetical protein
MGTLVPVLVEFVLEVVPNAISFNRSDTDVPVLVFEFVFVFVFVLELVFSVCAGMNALVMGIAVVSGIGGSGGCGAGGGIWYGGGCIPSEDLNMSVSPEVGGP